ncbi:MAG: dephospho-CoA kinase [Candidatus Omnitrophica bacterium]|nr:dephospho-CoA kinase [Candidatus Omnitrophota bacterium]
MVQKLRKNLGDKILVGITGVFGSGKSTVAEILGTLGASVVDADLLAHEVFEKGNPLYSVIQAKFSEAFQEGFNRKKLAEIVFSDELRRKELEAVIHPYVFKRIEEEMTKAKTKVVAVEVPLLFESGFHDCCCFTVVVKASQSVIQQRLEEKGFALEDMRVRTQAQMSLEEKCRKADFVIDNSKSIEETRSEVEIKVWEKLHSLLKGA